ncbi:MAG: AI-2E family transporter [Treponema sp.]
MQKPIKFQTVSFFILLAITVALVSKVFLPYASVLLWSAILYTMTSPLYHKIIGALNHESRWFQLKRRTVAAFFSVGIIILVAGILFVFIIKLIGQGQMLVKKIMTFFIERPHLLELEKNAPLNEFVLKVSMGTIDLSVFDLKKELMSFFVQYTNTIFKYATSIMKNIGNFILSLLFMCFALYFFFIDGQYLGSLFVTAIPIHVSEGQKLAAKIKDIITNLFKGYFLVSLCQFTAAFAVFLLFGVEGALLLSFLTFFSSFLPLVGCALVWIPVGIEICLTAGIFKGIVFLCTAGVFISSLDNFLRPMFLQNRIQIHPLLIFFSILGGIQFFKFNGIVLGPMFVILFFTLIDIARTADSSDTEI